MKGYFARVEPQAKKRIHYMLYFTLRDQQDVQRELGLPIKLPSIGLCGSGRLSHTDQMMSAFSKRPWLLWIPSVKSGAHCFRLVFFFPPFGLQQSLHIVISPCRQSHFSYCPTKSHKMWNCLWRPWRIAEWQGYLLLLLWSKIYYLMFLWRPKSQA